MKFGLHFKGEGSSERSAFPYHPPEHQVIRGGL